MEFTEQELDELSLGYFSPEQILRVAESLKRGLAHVEKTVTREEFKQILGNVLKYGFQLECEYELWNDLVNEPPDKKVLDEATGEFLLVGYDPVEKKLQYATPPVISKV
jgi:hypothetical protein